MSRRSSQNTGWVWSERGSAMVEMAFVMFAMSLAATAFFGISQGNLFKTLLKNDQAMNSQQANASSNASFLPMAMVLGDDGAMRPPSGGFDAIYASMQARAVGSDPFCGFIYRVTKEQCSGPAQATEINRETFGSCATSPPLALNAVNELVQLAEGAGRCDSTYAVKYFYLSDRWEITAIAMNFQPAAVIGWDQTSIAGLN